MDPSLSFEAANYFCSDVIPGCIVVLVREIRSSRELAQCPDPMAVKNDVVWSGRRAPRVYPHRTNYDLCWLLTPFVLGFVFSMLFCVVWYRLGLIILGIWASLSVLTLGSLIWIGWPRRLSPGNTWAVLASDRIPVGVLNGQEFVYILAVERIVLDFQWLRGYDRREELIRLWGSVDLDGEKCVLHLGEGAGRFSPNAAMRVLTGSQEAAMHAKRAGNYRYEELLETLGSVSAICLAAKVGLVERPVVLRVGNVWSGDKIAGLRWKPVRGRIVVRGLNGSEEEHEDGFILVL